MGWKLSTCERASQADPEAPGALPFLVIWASPKRDLLNALVTCPRIFKPPQA